jgi:hypothetical protein
VVINMATLPPGIPFSQDAPVNPVKRTAVAFHMVYGPTEAFTPEQLAAAYDINVLSSQRVNRAALPRVLQPRHCSSSPEAKV